MGHVVGAGLQSSIWVLFASDVVCRGHAIQFMDLSWLTTLYVFILHCTDCLQASMWVLAFGDFVVMGHATHSTDWSALMFL